MTTAHRPTFHNALGGEGAGGNSRLVPTTKVCARDLAGHTKLKTRQLGQDTEEELKEKNFKTTLHNKERQAAAKRQLSAGPLSLPAEATPSLGGLLGILPEIEDNPFPEDADDDPKVTFSSDDDSGDDSDDDEAELLRELERIKKEREEVENQKKAEKDAILAEEAKKKALVGNPLLRNASLSATDVSLKRSWDDDVVFRNQAKKQKTQKRFINDTVRSEFHKKFLAKYIV